MEDKQQIIASQEKDPSKGAQEMSSVMRFIQEIKEHLPIERLKEDFRATPRGLFLHKDARELFLEKFGIWLAELTQSAAPLNEQKLQKKVFNTAFPPLYYLVEQKRALIGYLAEFSLEQPERLGIPTYLGSLDNAANILHPRDPLLLCMPHVTVTHTSEGISFALEAEKRKVSFSAHTLREFSDVSAHSRRLPHEEGDEKLPLREVLRIFLEVLAQSHWSKPEQRLFLPHKYRNSSSSHHLGKGSLSLIVEQGKIVKCYEREGKNLVRFLNEERAFLWANGKRKFGSFEFLPPKNWQLGTLVLDGRKIGIQPAVFTEFVKGILSHAPQGAREWKRYSVVDCLEELLESLATSQPIDQKKIERHIPRGKFVGAKFWITPRWIFVFDKKSGVVACIDKAR